MLPSVEQKLNYCFAQGGAGGAPDGCHPGAAAGAGAAPGGVHTGGAAAAAGGGCQAGAGAVAGGVPGGAQAGGAAAAGGAPPGAHEGAGATAGAGAAAPVFPGRLPLISFTPNTLEYCGFSFCGPMVAIKGMLCSWRESCTLNTPVTQQMADSCRKAISQVC